MKSIVLAGDYGYIRQIETTIKSLCCYHEDLLIYVFNQDIPQEWFINTRKKVKGTGNDLLDIKLLRDDLRMKWEESTYSHINYMAYARYFIPSFVSEDIVLKYANHEYDEVYLIYNKFISALKYDLTCEKIIPIARMEGEVNSEYIFEPSTEYILSSLLPRFINLQVYQAILNNKIEPFDFKK